MRPLTKSRELASAHQVTNFLHNQFARTIENQVKEIENLIGLVATCGDMWSSPNNKMPYFGAMAAYIVIELRKKKRPLWKLKTTILGFRAVEGAHDGSNLGHYYFGLCRRVGIINVEKKVSKVSNLIGCCHMLTDNLMFLSLVPQPLITLPIMVLYVKLLLHFTVLLPSAFGMR